MIYELLNRELVFPNLKASVMEDVMRQVGGALTKTGYAKETYVDALIEREKEYPTALNVDGYGVAIPHTPVDHINNTAIAIAILNEPVKFIEMGSDDDEVDVRVVFMLCIAGKPGEHAHLDTLQCMMSVIQDTELLEKLQNAKTVDEILNLMKEKESSL